LILNYAKLIARFLPFSLFVEAIHPVRVTEVDFALCIRSYSNLECGFGEDIMELRIRENCDFVVLVNILTPIAHALFSWAALQTTVCLDMLKLKPL